MSRKSSDSSSTASQPSASKSSPPAYDEKNSDPLEYKNADPEEPTKEVKLKYPKSVFFIVTNEFCERFCYYGMRTVLILYLRNILGFSESESTVFYHAFIMLCYFSPVLGAIIADSWLGKFKTILYLSIVYACGSTILSVAAIPNTIPQRAFSFVGLFIIAMATGGIKPCVSAFGGEQFVMPQQATQLESFFSVFYFAVNAGSLISTYVTPILRSGSCFEEDSCFSAAFGLPALLMIVSVVIFAAGYPLYKIKDPSGNIFGDFCMCIGRAIRRKVSRKTPKDEKHDHWLEFASDKYDAQMIDDFKRVLAVGFIYIPLPIFWALYDQQGSRWTFQATRMNGDLGGGVVIKPDQMQIVNPLLILILVPIFDRIIYPLFKRCNLLTPLQRICCGLVLCGLSFVVSGFVEIGIQPTYEKIPGNGEIQLNFINTLQCDVNVNYYYLEDKNGTASLGSILGDSDNPPTFATDFLKTTDNITIEAFLNDPENCPQISSDSDGNTGLIYLGPANEKEGYSVLITVREGELKAVRLLEPEILEKSVNGNPSLGFIVNFNEQEVEEGKISIRRENYEKQFDYNTTSITETYPPLEPFDSIVQTSHQDTELGDFGIYFQPDLKVNATKIGNVTNLIQGGVYTVLIQLPFDGSNDDPTVLQIEVTSANTVSILWLLPQYFVVTVAEVMFSVTGLSFSFSQAPPTMRAILMAMWYLINAFGNLIVIIVEEVNGMQSRSAELFLFAGIMGIAAIVFTLLAIPYKYVETEEEKKKKKEAEARLSIGGTSSSSSSSSSSSDEDETLRSSGATNEAFKADD